MTNDLSGISYHDEVRRKLVHLSSLWMPAVICLVSSQWKTACLFGILFFGSLLVEHAYAGGNAFIIRIYDVFFGNMLRKKPNPKQWIISGGPPVLGAAFLVSLLFSTVPAACGMTVMLTGDTAAALIGRRFGKHKIVNGKSLEGSLAFIAAGMLCASLILFLYGAGRKQYLCLLAGVILSCFAELFTKQLHIDDNFSIPVVTGFCLTLGTCF